MSKTATTTHTPQLRFPKFSDNWEEKRLGEVAKFSKGRGLPKIEIVEGGIYKCIHYGELFTVYPELIKKIYSSTNIDNGYIRSFGDEILMPTSDVTPNGLATASALIESGVILGGDILIIRSEKLYNLFFSYYIRSHKKDIMRLVSGTTVVHIYASDLRKLKIQIPSLPEQEKIANFLSTVDQKIEQLQSLHQNRINYKQGVMQQIFSQSIRFQDEEGNDFPEWEEKKLGEIAKFSKGRGLPKIEIVEGGIYKCIHYGELFTVYPELIKKIYSSTNIDNGYIRSFGDEILMPTSDVTPNGLATASALMKSGVILGGDILIIRSEKLYNLFFSYYIKSHKKDIMRLVSGTTVVHIYASDLRKLKIQIPSLPEQEKIANFLSSLDEKIEQIDQQIEQLQVWKKGLLQKIFI